MVKKIRRNARGYFTALLFGALILAFGITFTTQSTAQSVSVVSPATLRVGEKLTYSVSFGKIRNAGSAETHVVSRGKLGGKDAIELRAKVKTLELVSAAFFLLDEARVAYIAPDSGLPLYISSLSLDNGFPKEKVHNYLNQSTSNFDLLSLLYKLRELGGIGTFPLSEDDQLSTAIVQVAAPERVKTDAGEFDTSVSTIQSELLSQNGIKDFRINFSTDEFRVPVLVRFKTVKGEFKLTLSLIVLSEPDLPAPSPTPIPTPIPAPTPLPSPTPVLYVENLPLLPELGFQLGELLTYRIASGIKPVGILSLNARERKLFEKSDSLRLTATISGVEQGINSIRMGDVADVQVDPDTLTPTRIEYKFATELLGLNQTVTFDKRSGKISFGGAQPVDSPIGTHSLLSLIYAMRSFNLKPSKDPSNPVNDTRVAVFWENQSYVFTLRPSNPEDILLNGEKVSAQLVTINTGNAQLDALAPKVWLGTETRIPVRFSVGEYFADLITITSNLPK
ncbi:MAG: DUF3108 domain-containing protein [Pyrinomonadaceae bacterium]